MSKSAAFTDDLQKLIFWGQAIAGLADNPAVGALTSLFLRLHTADPGEGGDATTNEVAYTGYNGVEIVRGPAGWTIANGSVSPVNAVEFPEMVGGANGTATHGSIAKTRNGPGQILYSGVLTPPIDYSLGIIPRLRTTSTITEE